MLHTGYSKRSILDPNDIILPPNSQNGINEDGFKNPFFDLA